MSANRGPAGDGLTSVLAYMTYEADMDGLVTVSDQEIADALGVTRSNVQQHIKTLVGRGALVPRGYSAGVKNHGIKAYLIAEEALA